MKKSLTFKQRAGGAVGMGACNGTWRSTSEARTAWRMARATASAAATEPGAAK